ncbi:MAG: helix-turn-helix transcriptional regulator [Bacteroidetes bacterium]|nr:MAG: helix-turn-helix transcriptional regulator [Bacteroidota bacterium]
MQDYSTLTNKDIAAKARALILADLSIYDSVPALAKKAGTNPYTLKKVFKEMYGESVFQFSRTQRMELAQKLLQETNYTLQTIGEMVGYSEGNNFQASFKVVTGMTPGAFRRRIGVI